MIQAIRTWLTVRKLRRQLCAAKIAFAEASRRQRDARDRNDDRDYGRAGMQKSAAKHECLRLEILLAAAASRRSLLRWVDMHAGA